MTVLLKGERHAHTLTAGQGNDDIVVAFDLPAESVLRRVSINMDIIGVALAFEREQALHYSLAMYMIELEDPDMAISYEDLWDRFVPKYTDVDTIDLDTGAADTTPFWEPGEANFDEVFDMGNMPLRMYYRRKRMTIADPGNAGLVFQPAETPFEPQWLAMEKLHIRLNKSIRVRKPSVVILGLATPSLDDTTTARAHLLEAEWGQIQYVESTLERALMDQLNIVEAGAETPWVEASLLLRKHLAPDVFEETAGAYSADNFNVFLDLHFEHTVPGRMHTGVIDLTP